jgi:hypothetical protein
MSILSVNIKLHKQQLREEKILKDKTIAVLSYLFFHSTCEHKVYTNINTLCLEINLPTASHNIKNNQSAVKEVLQNLICDNTIQLLNSKNITEVDNRELLVFQFVNYEQYVNPNYHYVSLSLKEYNQLLKCNEKFHKALNLYCNIKSYICMDDNCLHTCYPSVQTICKNLNCSKKTLMNLLKLLCEQKLLYIYHFSENDVIKTNYGNIQLVFSLEKYSKEQIVHQFIA